MSDDRPKFIGVFDGGFMAHGPPCKHPSGIEISCTFNGTSTYAVDDRGNIYNLALDMTSPDPRKYVWVMLRAGIVRNPNGDGS